MHILSLVIGNNPSRISGSEENCGRNYFMIEITSKVSDQSADRSSLPRVLEGRSMDSQGSKDLFKMRTEALLRLCTCADLLESSLDVHAISCKNVLFAGHLFKYEKKRTGSHIIHVTLPMRAHFI